MVFFNSSSLTVEALQGVVEKCASHWPRLLVLDSILLLMGFMSSGLFAKQLKYVLVYGQTPKMWLQELFSSLFQSTIFSC